jgi:hypothetical protein
MAAISISRLEYEIDAELPIDHCITLLGSPISIALGRLSVQQRFSLQLITEKKIVGASSGNQITNILGQDYFFLLIIEMTIVAFLRVWLHLHVAFKLGYLKIDLVPIHYCLICWWLA